MGKLSFFIFISFFFFPFFFPNTGRTAPSQPQMVQVYVSSELALVSWLVPSIAYTRESYDVTYSKLGSDVFETRTVFGSADIQAEQQEHFVVLYGLDANTGYMFSVTAVNSFSQSSSENVIKTTPSGGQL